MYLKKLLISTALGVLFAFSAFAQGETFSDPNVAYTFDLPDTSWKMTVKPSDISPNVEYVYGTRTSGHLEVRKLALRQSETLDDLITDEETKLQFKPGFVAGKEEVFKGSLSGKVYNFEFVKSGRNWSGRHYFLKADDSAYYVMRFEAYRENLLSIRNIMDQIARSFDLVKP